MLMLDSMISYILPVYFYASLLFFALNVISKKTHSKIIHVIKLVMTIIAISIGINSYSSDLNQRIFWFYCISFVPAMIICPNNKNLKKYQLILYYILVVGTVLIVINCCIKKNIVGVIYIISLNIVHNYVALVLINITNNKRINIFMLCKYVKFGNKKTKICAIIDEKFDNFNYESKIIILDFFTDKSNMTISPDKISEFINVIFSSDKSIDYANINLSEKIDNLSQQQILHMILYSRFKNVIDPDLDIHHQNILYDLMIYGEKNYNYDIMSMEQFLVMVTNSKTLCCHKIKCSCTDSSSYKMNNNMIQSINKIVNNYLNSNNYHDESIINMLTISKSHENLFNNLLCSAMMILNFIDSLDVKKQILLIDCLTIDTSIVDNIFDSVENLRMTNPIDIDIIMKYSVTKKNKIQELLIDKTDGFIFNNLIWSDILINKNQILQLLDTKTLRLEIASKISLKLNSDKFINLCNTFQISAVIIDCIVGQVNSSKILSEITEWAKYVDISTLILAIDRDDITLFRFILTNENFTNIIDSYNGILLRYSLINNKKKFINCLIDCGCDDLACNYFMQRFVHKSVMNHGKLPEYCYDKLPDYYYKSKSVYDNDHDLFKWTVEYNSIEIAKILLLRHPQVYAIDFDRTGKFISSSSYICAPLKSANK